MITKNYNFNITKDNERMCIEAINAMNDIQKALSHDDLIYLAGIAKKKPHFVQKAKAFVHLL